MSQLTLLKSLLGDDHGASDEVLQFYLDSAGDIICDLRDSLIVETKYLTTQINMAIELFNKRGAEGQLGHTENGISRTYSKADISEELLAKVTPMVKSPWSTTRVVT